MSQSVDYNIANQSGASFRAELNSILAAIVSQNSGSTAPTTTYAYQWWIDTSVTPALLKLRNGANNAWITVGDVTAANLGLATLASPTFTGTVTIPAGALISGYAPTASPTFTGTVTIPAGASISGYAALATAQSFSAAQRGTVSALTDGATITADFAVANNFSVTLGGNRTFANPTNLTAGQAGTLVITQDGTGSRSGAWGSYWKFPGGTAPTLTTTASAVDVIAYYVESATRITARLIADVK